MQTLELLCILYARYALALLKNPQETNTWQTSGLVIGSLAHHIPLHKYKKQSDETDGEPLKENWILRNKIELTPDQAADLCVFLTAQEEALKQIATDDDREAREALGKVYRLIAEYGRKEVGKMLEATKKKIVSIALPKGKYFTVSQSAKICNATSRQIRAWIRTGKLEAVDLPGLGMIIEAGKLNQFLNEKDSRSNVV